MKFLQARVRNFASYQDLTFNFDDTRLSLVHGNTGSGKSTLQDIIPWVLFGVTSKGGNVDDIRSWNTSESTVVELDLINQGTSIKVVRTRGKGVNDLYFCVGDDSTPRRGKDIPETQVQLNTLLNLSYELYSVCGSYNEYSPTCNFFSATASQRRELFEKLSDLSLSIRLTQGASDVKKQAKKTFSGVSDRLNQAIGRLEQLERTKTNVEKHARQWDEDKKKRLEDATRKVETFYADEQARQGRLLAEYTEEHRRITESIAMLESHSSNETCSVCNAPNKQEQARRVKLAVAKSALNELALPKSEYVENPWVQELRDLDASVSPFDVTKTGIFCDIKDAQDQLKTLKDQLLAVEKKIVALDQIKQIAATLRTSLLTSSIQQIESHTNEYLESYFDADIRVQFSLNNDNLEVNMWKSGHECSYRQLSKGQKGILKLCFSVSVMEQAANSRGLHLETLMFDEALDGLDENSKLKAFGLFDELSMNHPSVLVIDHNTSFHSLFSSSYHVTLIDDRSVIVHE